MLDLERFRARGLIRSERAGSGHRRYQRAALRRIAFIVFAQKMGLSLDEVAVELAKLPDNRVPNRADWARLSGSWSLRRARRRRQIQGLPELSPGTTRAVHPPLESARLPVRKIGT